MPDRTFNFFDDSELVFQDEGIYQGGGVIGLRKLDASDEPSHLGQYKERYIDLPPWSPRVFDRFTGFFTVCNLRDGDIKFQISQNNGSTFLWHDGTDWVEALLSGEYNSEEEIEKNILTYPLPFSALKIRMFLIPGILSAPSVSRLSILIEYRPHEMVEDALRSVKRFLFDRCNFVFPFHKNITDPSNEITFTYEDVGVSGDIEKTLTVREPIFVYNLTEDPKETNNLFDSFNGTDKIILTKMTSGIIKIIFTSNPEVHIQSDFDLIPISNNPSITIQRMSVTRSEWDGPGNPNCYEKNISNLTSTRREGLRKYKVKLRIRSYASKVIDAVMFTGGVRRAIEQEDQVKSINYDSNMEALWGVQTDSDWVTENLFAETYTPTFIWEDWSAQQKPKEVPLVDDPANGGGVNIHIGLLSDC